MKLRLIPALLLAATVSIAAHAQLPAPQLAPQPTILAQLEIRGVAPLFNQAARILAPVVPPQQVDAAVKEFFSGACPIDLLSLVGLTSSDPIRAVLYSKPDADEPGLILDLPAANGDIDAFFDVIARSCPSSPIPPAVGARLPSSARIYRLPFPIAGDDTRVLFLPHGNRVAAWPLALRGGVQPIQAARLVASAPSPAVEGVIAIRANLEALSALATSGRGIFAEIPADTGHTIGLALPVTDYALGFGLDDANHLRLDNAYALASGTPIAKYFSTIAAPAPFVGAILHPDAIAAAAQHSDTSLIDKTLLAELLDPIAHEEPAFQDLITSFAGLLARTAAAFDGDDSAWAIYPPADGKALPWVACTARPEGLDSLDILSDRFSALATDTIALGGQFLQTIEGNDLDMPVLEDINPLIEPIADRSIADVDVRTYVIRAPYHDDDTITYDLLTFDAALAGPALVLASLPDARLSEILAALAHDAPARPGIAALPAFHAAYGQPPPNASGVVIQLLPLLRGIAEKARSVDETRDYAEAAAPFLSATDGISLPLAAVVRPGSAPGSIHETLSLPLPDLHSVINALLPLAMGGTSDAPALDDDSSAPDPFDNW